VCDSEEDATGNLTGKVKCIKQEAETQAGEIVFEVEEGAINEKGWAKESFDVTITAPGETGMKVCIAYDGECTPTIPNDYQCEEVNIYDYVINPEACAAFGTSMELGQSQIKTFCADENKTLVNIVESVGISAQTLVDAGVISNLTIYGKYYYCSSDEDSRHIFEFQTNTATATSEMNLLHEGSNYVCVEAEGLQTKCEVYKFDETTPTLIADDTSVIVEPSANNEINTFLTSTYGPSNGSIVCKINGSEITNTSSLAEGTHAIICNAISNSGLSSANAILIITVGEQKTVFATLLVDTNGNGIAELGDEVCIEDECFYVLTNDGNNIRMLAKYRIDVSDNTIRKIRLQNTGTMTTEFASDTSSYAVSIAKDLVGDYKVTLEGLGATISEATLLTYDEVVTAPFNCQFTSFSCDTNYSWLYRDGNTTKAGHWTRSAYNSYMVYTILANSSYNMSDCDYTYGIRPVITIPTSALN
ncbi:MAG: hypothetical protein IJO27_05655, partial [Bacilli bacterium]|nr:hypothetical protein [Bacilli bacterium]